MPSFELILETSKMAAFSSQTHFCRCMRICFCLWLLGTVAASADSSPCGLPDYNLDPLIEGYGDLSNFSIPLTSPAPKGNCTTPPQILVTIQPDGFEVVEYDFCKGRITVLAKASGLSQPKVEGALGNALSKICGQAWTAENYNGYTAFPGGMSSRSSEIRGLTKPTGFLSVPKPALASSSSISGQGSQAAVLLDLNGDGNPDAVLVNSSGLTVQLLGSDGSVLSSARYSVGLPNFNSFGSNVIAGDFNGDGNPDLVISNAGSSSSNSGGVAILLGNGDGTFGPPSAVSAGLSPKYLVAADFNGDGVMDLAVGNLSSGDPSGLGPGTVSVLPGNGDGTFAAPVTYPVGENSVGFPFSLIALDLNGDGLLDLALANHGDNSISVLLNAGGGTFQQAAVTALPYGADFLAYSDFNHDGNLDLLVASTNSNVLMMLAGNGDGSFQQPVAYVTGNNPASIGVAPLSDGNTLIFTTDSITGNAWIAIASPDGTVGAPAPHRVGGSPTGVAAADLNGDGVPDVVVSGGANDVEVLVSGAGNNAATVGYALASSSPRPQAVAIADLNNDGKPDVVTANGAGSVSVLLGNGDGTLGTPMSTTVDPNVLGLTFGDFNGDGKLDMAVASYGLDFSPTDNGSVTVLSGNGDGTFGAAQAFTIGSLHPVAVAAADLNGDGILRSCGCGGGSVGNGHIGCIAGTERRNIPAAGNVSATGHGRPNRHHNWGFQR